MKRRNSGKGGRVTKRLRVSGPEPQPKPFGYILCIEGGNFHELQYLEYIQEEGRTFLVDPNWKENKMKGVIPGLLFSYPHQVRKTASNCGYDHCIEINVPEGMDVLEFHGFCRTGRVEIMSKILPISKVFPDQA